jgi:hypothetical protein
MSEDVLIKLGELLRRAVTRPQALMGSVSVEAVQGFLGGLYCTYSVLGVVPTLALRSRATASQGWVFSSTHGIDRMREKGLTEEQIVHELLLIELALLDLMTGGSAGAA